MMKTSDTEMPPSERPGSSTSEYKITLATTAAGLVLVILGYLIDKDSSGKLIDTGMFLMLGSGPTYVGFRTWLKGKSIAR